MEPRSSRGILCFSDRPCKELLVVPGGATFRLDGTLNGVPSMAITARLSHKLHQTLGDDGIWLRSDGIWLRRGAPGNAIWIRRIRREAGSAPRGNARGLLRPAAGDGSLGSTAGAADRRSDQMVLRVLGRRGRRHRHARRSAAVEINTHLLPIYRAVAVVSPAVRCCWSFRSSRHRAYWSRLPGSESS